MGTHRVSYASTSYGEEEIQAVVDVLRRADHMIVAGPLVREFERRIAALFGKRHGVMLNSGSSANLLALELLDLPKGAEVITPALTFATTIAPILQLGLKPRLVDVTLPSYQVDVDAIEAAITGRTGALLIPLLAGNIPDLVRIRRLARAHGLPFIEDSCDTLAGQLHGKPTGAYSDLTTTSFYASHIVTAAGGGGMLCVRTKKLADRALVKSSWGRHATLYGVHKESEDLDKRFGNRVLDAPYDGKFLFSEVGYNFQCTDLQAAFALKNLERLDGFRARRRHNFAALNRFFSSHRELFLLPGQIPGAEPTWLAYPLCVSPNVRFSRYDLAVYLERHGIQTRPMFTGNIARQPGFSGVFKKAGRFPVADWVMRRGLLLGCHQDIDDGALDYLFSTVTAFLRAL